MVHEEFTLPGVENVFGGTLRNEGRQKRSPKFGKDTDIIDTIFVPNFGRIPYSTPLVRPKLECHLSGIFQVLWGTGFIVLASISASTSVYPR